MVCGVWCVVCGEVWCVLCEMELSKFAKSHFELFVMLNNQLGFIAI